MKFYFILLHHLENYKTRKFKDYRIGMVSDLVQHIRHNILDNDLDYGQIVAAAAVADMDEPFVGFETDCFALKQAWTWLVSELAF